MSTYVETIRAQQRAARHAASLPLIVNALAVAFLSFAATTPWWLYPQAFVPGVAYLALHVVMVLRRRATGIGSGREAYGVLGAVFLGLAFVPLAFVLFIFLGPTTILGAGLLVLGARGRDPWLWAPGLALMIVGPLTANHVFDNHAPFLGPHPGAIALGFTAAALLLVAGAAYAVEKQGPAPSRPPHAPL